MPGWIKKDGLGVGLFVYCLLWSRKIVCLRWVLELVTYFWFCCKNENCRVNPRSMLTCLSPDINSLSNNSWILNSFLGEWVERMRQESGKLDKNNEVVTKFDIRNCFKNQCYALERSKGTQCAIYPLPSSHGFYKHAHFFPLFYVTHTIPLFLVLSSFVTCMTARPTRGWRRGCWEKARA